MKTISHTVAFGISTRFFSNRVAANRVSSARVVSTLYAALLGVTLCTAAAPALADQSTDTKPVGVVRQSRPAEPLVIIRAQGHARHQDFVARSSKRADLRANVQRKGLDMAFTEWLRDEHPHAYRDHVTQMARRQPDAADNKVAAN